MAKPVIVVSCDPEAWQRGDDWQDDLKADLRRVYGAESEVLILPPGVSYEVYWYDEDDLAKALDGACTVGVDEDDDEEEGRCSPTARS